MDVKLAAENQADYTMRLGEQSMAMNPLLGQMVTLRFQGQINCVHCQRLTKKASVVVSVIPAHNALPSAICVSSNPNSVTLSRGPAVSLTGVKRSACRIILFISPTVPA
jgi:hypothetical protein